MWTSIRIDKEVLILLTESFTLLGQQAEDFPLVCTVLMKIYGKSTVSTGNSVSFNGQWRIIKWHFQWI